MSEWWSVVIPAALDAALWGLVCAERGPSAAGRRLLRYAARRSHEGRPRSMWAHAGAPALQGLVARLRPLASRARRRQIADRLVQAGLDWDPALFDGLKIAGAAAGLAAGAAAGVFTRLPAGSAGWMALAGGLGYLAPGIWVRRRRGTRERELRACLPDALDVLVICLRAGLGLQAAVAEYAQNASGMGGEVFRRYLADLALGRTPEDGLAEMARRYPGDELGLVAAGLAHGIRLGSPMAEILEQQAAHFRALALRRAEEGARMLSTRLVLPLVAFVFPQVFIIGLGPLALRLIGPGGLLH